MSEFYVLSRDSTIEEGLARVLRLEGGLPQSSRCANSLVLADRLQRTPAPIVFVDADPAPIKTIEEIEPLVNKYVGTRFILICQSPGEPLILRAMQAGIRHVQPRDRLFSELPDVLARFQPGALATVAKRGTAVTVLQASGGCGATTVSVNLAQELHLLASAQILLIDLDLSYGAIASYLGLSGQYGIGEVLARDGMIDGNLINTTAVRYTSGYHVLMSPASVNFARAQPIGYDRIDQLLVACRQEYPFTVIDAPRVASGAVTNLPVESDVTLIVFQQLVKDIHIARAIMVALQDEGVPEQRIIPVINRYTKRGAMIKLKEAEDALRCEIRCVQNDFPSAARGINYGKPLSELVPRSYMRKDIAALAAQVANLVNG